MISIKIDPRFDKNLRIIALSDLEKDPRAQREHDAVKNRRLIQEIVDKYDPAKFEVIRVAQYPDGSLKVVDGWHRCMAARQMGANAVWCDIHALTPAEAADIFQAQERKVKLTTHEHHKVGVNGERDHVSKDIDNIARNRGFEIVPGGASKGTRLVALSRVRTAYKRGVLAETLDVIKKAWGMDPDTENTNGQHIIDGISLLLSMNKRAEIPVDINHLAAKLSKKLPDRFILNAGNKGQGREVARMMARLYNANLTKRPKIVAPESTVDG